MYPAITVPPPRAAKGDIRNRSARIRRCSPPFVTCFWYGGRAPNVLNERPPTVNVLVHEMEVSQTRVIRQPEQQLCDPLARILAIDR